MPQKGERDLAKEKYWRTKIREFLDSGLNGTEFCRERNISYSSLCDWRKVIRARDAEARGEESRPKKRTARKSVRAGVRNARGNRFESEHFSFAPIQLVDHDSVAVGTRAGTLELVVPSGLVLRVTDGCSIKLLTSVLTLLGVK